MVSQILENTVCVVYIKIASNCVFFAYYNSLNPRILFRPMLGNNMTKTFMAFGRRLFPALKKSLSVNKIVKTSSLGLGVS